MKHVAALLFLAVALSSARADILPKGKTYPEFQVGVTGMMASISKDGVLSVTKITPGTPAQGKLRPGDVLLAVDGESLAIQDPRHPLGNAITRAEGGDGRMSLKIRRGDQEMDVTIVVEAIGAYSRTWPANCKKSQRIIDDTAAFILKHGGPDHSITGYLEALFLMSTGNAKYLPAVKSFAHADAARPVPGLGSSGLITWGNGYRGVFLGEYYLRTGDRTILPTLKALCDSARDTQYYGGWGHGAGVGVGYVTGGHLHAAGEQLLTTLILGRECGVELDEGAYNRALRLFFRYAGHGAVPYGDHHPTMYWGDNGKDGMLAAALKLLPDDKFQRAAQILAFSEVDSYTNHENGHGSPFGNQTWRTIVDVLVPEKFAILTRRHKDKLTWYYDMCRMPGGGFRALPQPGNGNNSIGRDPKQETGLMAMAYTSHRRKLRINGAPRTQYSVKHQPTDVERSLPDTDFLIADFCPGGDDMGLEQHEIRAKFRNHLDADGKVKGESWGYLTHKDKEHMPVAWYAKLMRHYNPILRSWAAHGLGYQGKAAIPEILKALQDKDARVRVAGMEAAAGTLFWGPSFTEVKITPEMIREHFLPYILKPLQNPEDFPMWEQRHALMALSRCDVQTIAAHARLIEPYFASDEWWLRVAAFTAVKPLIEHTDLIRPLIKSMMASYDGDTHLPTRRWGPTAVFKEILAKNPDLKAEVLAGMAKSVGAMVVREGHKQNIDLNNIFETLRYVDMAKHPENAIPILPAIERIYPDLKDLPGYWVFTGARWGNIGLIKAAERLGKDGAPFIASMKRLLPEVERRAKSKDRRAKLYQEALDAAKQTIAEHEKKYGVVKTD
jgi:hypothetical protein